MVDKSKLIKIGFWDADHTPKAWEGRRFSQGSKEQVLLYLSDRGFRKTAYRGHARCRICDERLGSSDYSDGKYLWPQQVEHYILKHGLVPPADFIEWVREQINPKDERLEEAVSYVRDVLLDMAEEERVELMHNLCVDYCRHCGSGPHASYALPCRCWDDS